MVGGAGNVRDAPGLLVPGQVPDQARGPCCGLGGSTTSSRGEEEGWGDSERIPRGNLQGSRPVRPETQGEGR